jgi:glycosyltransferase involved in cell wall biosynthesis
MTKDPKSPSVAFLVNGDPQGSLGHRARSFAERLAPRYAITLSYRSRHKLVSLIRFLIALWRTKPDLVYVFDLSYSGVIAALFYKRFLQRPVVIETGDAIFELAKSIGRGRVGLWLTKYLEEAALTQADFIVVRGTEHQRLLGEKGIQRVEVIPDGVDTTEVRPVASEHLRHELGFDDQLVIGLVGSLTWSERLKLCYGWELIEALRLLRDQPVRGMIIGSGSGLSKLKAKAVEYGIEEKVLFLGTVPYEQLPHCLSAMDVCLSTQTNDVVGQVRTTGKLPLYLACGRYVLASRVGEAARVLPDEMLIEYDGVKDEEYPRRLAERILMLLSHRRALVERTDTIELARRYFDYSVLTERMRSVLDRLLGARVDSYESRTLSRS